MAIILGAWLQPLPLSLQESCRVGATQSMQGGLRKMRAGKGRAGVLTQGHLTSRVPLPSTVLRGFDLQGVDVERQGLPILPSSLTFTQNP